MIQYAFREFKDSSKSSNSKDKKTLQQEPLWVTRLNTSLEAYPAETAIAYVALDAISVFSVYAVLSIAHVSVPGDFALAFAISRALRRFRLPVDIAVAAVLLRIYPPLSLVRPSRLIGLDTSAPTTSGVSGIIQRASAAVALAADKFGLAFFVSQRLTGLASVSTIYFLIRNGINVEHVLTSIFGADLVSLATGSGAGAAIGLWAAAAVSASALYPLVILGAGPIGYSIGVFRRGITS